MYTFKYYIGEMANINGITHAPVLPNKRYSHPTMWSENAKHIADLGSQHEIHKKSDWSGHTYIAWNRKTKKIDGTVSAPTTRPLPWPQKWHSGIMQSPTTNKRSGAGFKMKEMYKAIMKDGNHIVGTSHSKGAVKLWNSMLHDPEIEIHGHHSSTGETTRLKPGDRMHSETLADPIYKMHLVAHIKGTPLHDYYRKKA